LASGTPAPGALPDLGAVVGYPPGAGIGSG